MKRPIIGFCTAFAACSAIELRFHLWSKVPIPMLILVILVILAYALCVFAKTAPAGVLISGAICGMVFTFVYVQAIVQPIETLAGQTREVEAVVLDHAAVYEDEQRVTLSVTPKTLGLSVYHPPIKIPTYLPLSNGVLEPGDRVKASLSFYLGQVYDGFEQRSHYQANGFFILARNSEDGNGNAAVLSVIKSPCVPVWAYPMNVAQGIKARISRAVPEREAGFITAILIGDKEALSDDDQLALRKSGLSHVTAVSGMHVGFLVSFFFVLLGRKWGSVFSIFAILFFIPMAGASPSVIRAGIMYIIAALGFCLGRERDGLNSLCIALLVLLLQNPYSIASLSLQLSFAATLGLIAFSSRLQAFLMRPFQNYASWKRKIICFFVTSASCSISAMAFTTPILLRSFGYVSVFAPLANLLAVSIVGLLFICGHISGLLLLLIPSSGPLCGFVLTPITDYLLWVADFVSSLRYGLVYWDNVYGMAALAAIYMAFALLLLAKPKLKMRFILPPLCGILLLAAGLGFRDYSSVLTISVLPSGAGQSIIAATQGSCILIDCGASGHRNAAQNVREYMKWNDLEAIDTLILTAVDKTHARNVPELLDTMHVRQIVIPNGIRESELSREIISVANHKMIPITIWAKTGEHSFTDTPLAEALSLVGGVERKLAVRIKTSDTNTLIAHSLTQRMLNELLQEQPLTADTVVLAESNLAKTDLLQASLTRLDPDKIILQSGYSTAEKLLQQYPVLNTYLQGEITVRTHMPK